MSKHDVFVPGTTVPNVGVSGSTLGGCIGFATRYAGLACDHVLSAKMVTSEGSIIDQGMTDLNLMKGIRGGGPFYAVVYEWKFSVLPAPRHPRFDVLRWGVEAPMSPEESRNMLGAFMNEKPWKWDDAFGMVEGRCVNNRFSLHIHYMAPSSEVLTQKVNVFKGLKTIERPVHEASEGNDTWEEYVARIARPRDIGQNSRWTVDNLAYDSLALLTRANNTGFWGVGLMFDAANCEKQQFVQLLVDTCMSVAPHAGVSIRLSVLGGKAAVLGSKTEMLTSWPYRNAALEVQIDVDAEMPNSKETLETIIQSLKPHALGFNYNYLHESINGFEDYFPQQGDLTRLKQRVDPQNRLMRDTLGAPPPKPGI
jgi:FAD/FMN-containing dehydrogenase